MFRHPLVREIALVLLLKLALVAGLWFAFFRLPEPVVTDANGIDRMLFGPANRHDVNTPR